MSVHLVPDGLDGERVDVAAARMTGLSRSRIETLIAEGKDAVRKAEAAATAAKKSVKAGEKAVAGAARKLG